MVELRTTAEAATALRLSRSSIDRLLKAGKLESVRIGARRLVTLESIERLATPNAGANPAEGN